MISILLRVALCWLLAATPSLCLAAAQSIDIAIPERTASFLDIAKAIQHSLYLLDGNLRSDIVTPTEVSERGPGRRSRQLVITVGDRLLPWAGSSRNPYAQTLAFYATSTAWAAQSKAIRGSALFRDQPLARQLELARLLFPDLHAAVVLVDAGGYPPGLMTLATESPVDISILNIDEEQHWPRALSQLMATHDLLLAHDDNSIYNHSTVRSLLLTTYRHGRVMIGPTRAFVDAGSLASVYTSTDQHLRQLSDTVAQWLRSGQLAAAQYPVEFRVAVNRQVAASLGLRLPAEVELANRLRHVEEARP